ncbi:hypothetical protein FHS77_000830 [Paenochrobactrum gallinarii]|uniref:Holin n=1 Tax=Paenochrobactrum gallinarii TaxID=643673 RepID=A0A841LSR1_9HYPH|nr:hypothetical protein [Paenochrobactrum gallinarii]MBB6260306.1 hypothetical protein [Paenochrobactrum gallinarii]
MIENKPWYLSRTIWGSMVALLYPAGNLLGIPIGVVEQATLVDALMQLAAAGAGIFAIIGRMKATSRIS